MSFLPSTAERRSERMKRGAHSVPWGIRFLDEATLGIFPDDTPLLGGYTGVGKTQIAVHVAFAAAKTMEVGYWALEERRNAVEERLIWAELVKTFFERHPHGLPGIDLRYRAWLGGGLDASLGDLEHEVYERIKFTLANIRTSYGGASFSVHQFVQEFEAMSPTISLGILDHSHYLELPDKDEQRGLKKAVQSIRQAVIRKQKPILLLAHLRKSSRGDQSAIPDIDDFHGSSDLTKIATDVIIAARAETFAPKNGGRATWFYIAKSRDAGDSQGYAGLVNYDTREGRYSDKYYLARVRRFSEPEFLQASQMPRWAKSAEVFPQ